jgi:hypothetical protein
LPGDKITSETLKKTIAHGTLTTLKNAVNNNSKIIFYTAGLVENKAPLKTLKNAFLIPQKVLEMSLHRIKAYLAESFQITI